MHENENRVNRNQRTPEGSKSPFDCCINNAYTISPREGVFMEFCRDNFMIKNTMDNE